MNPSPASSVHVSADEAHIGGDAQGKAATLSQMANIKMAQGDWGGARELAVSSLEIAKQLYDLYWLGMNYAKLG